MDVQTFEQTMTQLESDQAQLDDDIQHRKISGEEMIGGSPALLVKTMAKAANSTF